MSRGLVLCVLAFLLLGAPARAATRQFGEEQYWAFADPPCRRSTPSGALRGALPRQAATFPGGAVHGVPGDAAARAALA